MSDEPLGLPTGTVRAVIAIALTATLCQQVIVGAIDSVAFLAIVGPFLGYYAGTRSTEATIKSMNKEQELEAPAYDEPETQG